MCTVVGLCCRQICVLSLVSIARFDSMCICCFVGPIELNDLKCSERWKLKYIWPTKKNGRRRHWVYFHIVVAQQRIYIIAHDIHSPNWNWIYANEKLHSSSLIFRTTASVPNTPHFFFFFLFSFNFLFEFDQRKRKIECSLRRTVKTVLLYQFVAFFDKPHLRYRLKSSFLHVINIRYVLEKLYLRTRFFV